MSLQIEFIQFKRNIIQLYPIAQGFAFATLCTLRFYYPIFLRSVHSCVSDGYSSQRFWYCSGLPTGCATLWLRQTHKKVIKFLFTLVIGSEKHTFEYIVWNIFPFYFVLVVAALSGSASLFAKRVKRTRPKGGIIAKKQEDNRSHRRNFNLQWWESQEIDFFS